MTDRFLTTYEYDPAVPSKNPRIGDGPPTPEQLAEYRKMYPGRGYAGVAPALSAERWGYGIDLGYRYSHKIS
jgi:hypothetical protein